MVSLLVSFVGGDLGAWDVERITAVRGDVLAAVPRLSALEGPNAPLPDDAEWALRGVTSNERYTSRAEQEALKATSPPLGRADATAAALIPVRKSPEWWQPPYHPTRGSRG